jgi:S1-C subfamily serine protease
VDRSNPKIQRDAKGTFTVDRSLVNWYVTHIPALNRLGWSSKHEGADGRSVGMRIGGVQCGNDLHLAGIRSGDVVHRVNGHEVRSIPQAILVYRKVRKDPSIRVELTRRGKPVTLTYRLS